MPRVNSFVALLLLLSIPPAATGGQWKSFTSKREVRSVAVAGTGIWAATSGGLFSYRPADNTFRQYTTSEGLKTIDLTAVSTDSLGNVWIGASNGFLHRLNPAASSWTYISDIANRPDPQKRIHRLEIFGDTLFILSDIGVSVFSVSRMEFLSTFSHFGSGANQIVGGALALTVWNGSIWVATQSGIASTPVGNPNPLSPDSWQSFQAFSVSPTIQLQLTGVTGFAVLHDTLYAGCQSGLVYFDGTGWTLAPNSSGMQIVDLLPTSSSSGLTGITPNELWTYNNGQFTQISINAGSTSTFTALGSQTVIGTISTGILVQESSQWISEAPPGPASNNFVGIAVDNRGVVWAGTGTGNGNGFMSFDGRTWKSYTVQSNPALLTNNYYVVSIGRGNSKWVSSAGRGVALLDDTGRVVRLFNHASGIPLTIEPTSPTSDSQFVVVGGVGVDSNGVTWITNRTAKDSTAAVLFYPDSSLRYTVKLQMRNPNRIFTNVVVDQNNTKWFSNFSPFETETAYGFNFYNETYALPGTTNGWGVISQSSGLTSNSVFSIALDHDGQIWAGTDQGINIIFDPSNPAASIASYYPLQDQVIQSIVVDPINNKWVGTKSGVYLMSSDGTSILNQYTFENTGGQLLDDNVLSIAMDQNTGTVYFGTEKGLSSLTTSAITANQTYDNLSFAPNPFYLPAAQPLRIDGLIESSSLKILSIDGSLVRQLTTPGGRIGSWDGRNDRGDLVATGIYLVVAYIQNGTSVATGKVAVIRK